MKIILEGGFTLQRDLHRGVAALDYIVLRFGDVDVGCVFGCRLASRRPVHLGGVCESA